MTPDKASKREVAPLAAIFIAAGMVILCAQPGSGAPIPRMPDGRPDLQGTYDIATSTPLERPVGQPLELTTAQAQQVEQQVLNLVSLANRPSSATRTAPPMGGDGSTGNSGNVGGYNVYWIGGLPTRVTVLDGKPRASFIIDPADGRLPPPSPDRVNTVARSPAEPPDAADNPESRTLSERCLIVGSGATAPVLPYLYNNLYQIVQTPEHVVISSEMIHDARIVRIGGQHPPPGVRTWLGDSIGRWEQDTLVVDTTNFKARTGVLTTSDRLHVVEHFSRIDAQTLRYRFTVEDPQMWARPWTGEYAWPVTSERMLEYACHENNYDLGNILRGARVTERELPVNR